MGNTLRILIRFAIIKKTLNYHVSTTIYTFSKIYKLLNELKPSHILRKGKVNFQNLFNQFEPQILKNGKDCLDVFIKEGLAIKAQRPPINGMLTNGYVF